MINVCHLSRRLWKFQIKQHHFANFHFQIIDCNPCLECKRWWKKSESFVNNNSTYLICDSLSSFSFLSSSCVSLSMSLLNIRIWWSLSYTQQAWSQTQFELNNTTNKWIWYLVCCLFLALLFKKKKKITIGW